MSQLSHILKKSLFVFFVWQKNEQTGFERQTLHRHAVTKNIITAHFEIILMGANVLRDCCGTLPCWMFSECLTCVENLKLLRSILRAVIVKDATKAKGGERLASFSRAQISE